MLMDVGNLQAGDRGTRVRSGPVPTPLQVKPANGPK
jgi:hypothetical protein